jgi:hypothetical protein
LAESTGKTKKVAEEGAEKKTKSQFLVMTRYRGDGIRQYGSFEEAVRFAQQQFARNGMGSQYTYDVVELVAKVEPAFAPIQVKLVGDRIPPRTKGTVQATKDEIEG